MGNYSKISKYNQLDDNNKKDIISQLYIEQKQSFAEIADKYDTYPNRIRRDAKKLGIPIRNKSEAQKNALKQGKVEHPTKGTERDKETKNKIGKSLMSRWDNLTDTERQKIRETSLNNWNNKTDEEKKYMQQLANRAVRESSKSGSKLEKFIHQNLLAAGYKVDFHKEQILSNTKLQIDLFLKSHNIAIEVDGPSHFAPVWGEEALKKNQKYDANKTGLLLGKNISIIRIKQKKDFSLARANFICNKLHDTILYIIKQKDIQHIEIEDTV